MTFPTLVDSQVFTGAHTQIIRDNFAETAPAKATAAGQFFVATGANVIAARTPASAATVGADTTTSGTFGALSGSSGPAVTVTTGPSAFVAFGCRANNGTASQAARAGVAVSGATTTAADINYALNNSTGIIVNLGYSFIWSSTSLGALNAGSNTFTLQYRTDGTGTGTFSSRVLTVIPF